MKLKNKTDRMNLFGQLTHTRAMLKTYAKVWKINKILLWDFLFLGPWRKSVYLTIQQPVLCSSYAFRAPALMLGSVLWKTVPFYLSPRWWLLPVFKLWMMERWEKYHTRSKITFCNSLVEENTSEPIGTALFQDQFLHCTLWMAISAAE